MKFGAVLPNVGELAVPEILITLAQYAEALGMDGIFLSDHLTLPTVPHSRYPYRSDGAFPVTPDQDILESVVTLTYLAAMTRRIGLGFSILVLPYRQPVLNAKMLSTLDVFSGGRLILGAGVGWMEEEYRALGVEFARRGTLTDEHLQMLKACWTMDELEYHGEYYRIDGMTMYPKPLQKPHPPIWTGGTSPRALRRAAYLADGWQGIRQRPEDVTATRQKLEQLRQEAGRTDSGFEISLRAGLDFTSAPLPEARLPLRGSPEQVTEDVLRYQEAGLTYLVVEPRARDTAEFMSQLERLVHGVKPHL